MENNKEIWVRFLSNKVGVMIAWFCINAFIALIGATIISYGPPVIGAAIVIIAAISFVFLLIVSADSYNDTLEDIADLFKKDE